MGAHVALQSKYWLDEHILNYQLVGLPKPADDVEKLRVCTTSSYHGYIQLS